MNKLGYANFNSILTGMVHTLIAFELIDREDVGLHYQMHSRLFQYWEPIIYEHEFKRKSNER